MSDLTRLTKIVLTEHDMPTHWYNINADLPAAGVQAQVLQTVLPEEAVSAGADVGVAVRQA